jgi:tetratricopeptide (TPR) repeat protein
LCLCSSKGIGSPGALNQIALGIARIDKPDLAIEWLKIATEMYPKEAALYGTLGDLYLKPNQREQAINAFKKALEIDPNFEHARTMLKKLME